MTKSTKKTEKKKMGRPPAEEARKPRSFRATDDEWKLYSEAAQASGIGDCSQWMRFILNREARMQLGGSK